jgi:2-dehydro-3-deoxyglucarate aldolase
VNKLKAIEKVRNKLSKGVASIGSWMQLPDSSVAEIMGYSGYDWVVIDLEHGSFSLQQLPNLFRAIELGGALPLVRVAQGNSKDCKQALDAGAAGLIIPMVESAEQLHKLIGFSKWPPAGNRGVGFSRANRFGENFNEYFAQAQNPLIIAMIESIEGINNIESILQVKGLDSIFIGPYDLSASLKITGDFSNQMFTQAIDKIRSCALDNSIPCGIHVVEPVVENLKIRVKEGYQFIAYSIDSVFLSKSAKNPTF